MIAYKRSIWPWRRTERGHGYIPFEVAGQCSIRWSPFVRNVGGFSSPPNAEMRNTAAGACSRARSSGAEGDPAPEDGRLNDLKERERGKEGRKKKKWSRHLISTPRHHSRRRWGSSNNRFNHEPAKWSSIANPRWREDEEHFFKIKSFK